MVVVLAVCMLCAWERWEYERSVCAVGMYVWGRDVMLLVCDVTCDMCVECVRCGDVWLHLPSLAVSACGTLRSDLRTL